MNHGLSDRAYNILLKNCGGSDEKVSKLVKFWGVKICERGYAPVDYDNTGIMCIEKIDQLHMFSDDSDATKQAIKDGIKIIPVNELPPSMPSEMRFFGYVDTPQNRRRINELYGSGNSVGLMEQKVKEVKSRFTKVIDVYEDDRFTEITGKVGGDTVTYRVYSDGSVTER